MIDNKLNAENAEWESLLDMLSTTHTYNMHSICQALKCSLTWAKTYVLPYLKEEGATISLGNGYPFGTSSSGQRAKPWTFIIQQKLREIKKDKSIVIKDLLWVDKKAFETFIYTHSTATQQVKNVPLDYFVRVEERRDFANKYRNLMAALDHAHTPNAYRGIISDQNKLFNQYLSYEGKRLLEEGERYPNKRREVKTLLSVPVPNVEFSLWKAVHDIKDYGDTDEMIYRQLFKNASVRIELRIENPAKYKLGTDKESNSEHQELKDGCKVFYAPDVNPVFNGNHLPHKLIEASVWEEVKKDFMY